MSGSSNTRSAEPSPGPKRPKRLERRRRVPRWASAAIAAGVLWAGAVGVVASPVFHARSIEVTGATHLDRAQLLRLAGLSPGMNVLWLDTAAAARRLEGNRWIASATVTRSLPSTVRVSVTERTPAAEVKDGTRWALVSADGTVLDRVPSDPGLPLLVASSGDVRRLRQPAAVVGGMTPWVRSRVSAVATDRKGSVVLHLASGVQVLFGTPSDIAVKDQALAGILHWMAATDATIGYIDLRAPLAPAIGAGSGPPETPATPASNKAASQPTPGAGA